MINAIRRVIAIRKTEVWQMIIIMLGGYLFGFGLMFIMNGRGNSEEGVFPLGSLMAFIILILVYVVIRGIALMQDFNYAIGMSVTRRNFLISYAVVIFLEFILYYLVFVLSYLLETGIYKGLGIKVMDYATKVPIMFHASTCVVLAVLAISVQFFICSMILRFGKVAFWIMWGLYMFVCIAPGRVSNSMEGKHSVIGDLMFAMYEGIVKHGPNGVLILILIMCFVMLVPAIILLRKQKVVY